MQWAVVSKQWAVSSRQSHSLLVSSLLPTDNCLLPTFERGSLS